MHLRRFAVVSVVIASACSAPIERTIEYDPRHGDATSMDVYLPDEDGGHPALVFYHGGAWRWFHRRAFRPYARRFARAGYVTVSVEYRLVPSGRFPNAVRDGACALAYVQNHADELGVDPARIAIMGYSAGGQIAGLLATAPDHPGFTADCTEGPPAPPRAMISIAGPMDMFGLADVSALEEYLGGSPSAVPSVYSLASPISHVTADDPPFLFVHGSRDVLVPIEHATEMQDALESVGVEATLLEMRGSGHITNYAEAPGDFAVVPPYDSPEAWITITDFLDRHLGKP